MDQLDRFKKLLGEHGYSLTKPRQTVFSALLNADEPISITELAKQLPIDKVSVYRTIELFEKIGIAVRVWSGFKSQIELSEAFSPHHHHFTCVRCGKTDSIKSDEIERHLEELEARNGFRLTQHSIELHGYCKLCQSN